MGGKPYFEWHNNHRYAIRTVDQVKVRTSGAVDLMGFVGAGFPSLYAYGENFGPCELPVHKAFREFITTGKPAATFTVLAWSGTFGSGLITLKGVRLFWSIESAMRSYGRNAPRKGGKKIE